MMGCGRRRGVESDAQVRPEPLEEQNYCLQWEDREVGRSGAHMPRAEFEMHTELPRRQVGVRGWGSGESSPGGRYK